MEEIRHAIICNKVEYRTIFISYVWQMNLLHFKSLQKFIHSITMILIKMRNEQMVNHAIFNAKESTSESLDIGIYNFLGFICSTVIHNRSLVHPLERETTHPDWEENPNIIVSHILYFYN